MAESSTLESLELRKQLLVARSEIQRQTLALEVARLREATAWMSTAAVFTRRAAPWLVLAAPMAGYVLGRKRSAWRSLAASVVWGWRIYRRLRRFLDSAAGE